VQLLGCILLLKAPLLLCGRDQLGEAQVFCIQLIQYQVSTLCPLSLFLLTASPDYH
jgi:hypothetical protein